jgi:hypothetical protein
MSAENRNAVSRAANEIDQDLRNDPETLGESRPGGLRVHFVSPLGVAYRVSPEDLLVQLAHVWSFETTF